MTTFGNWEVDYEGIDSPADHVPQAFAWDNPVDDDWNEARVVQNSFSFNNPSAGFLTVDRASNPLDWGKGGVISRRDEYLRKSAGFTMEFRVKLYDNSGLPTLPDAFNAYYLTDDGTVYGIYLSPGVVKVGGYDQVTGSVNFPTTDGFHTYRMVQSPNSVTFTLFIDDSPTPILIGTGNTKKIGSVTNENYPMVIIGGEGAFHTHYTLDFVRYRRGGYPPGAVMPAVQTRTPPPLPTPAPSAASDQFIPGFDSYHYPYDAYAIFGPYGANGGCTQGWSVHDSIIEYNSKNGPSATCAIPNVPGLVGRGDVTVEARLKVLPDSGTRGFSIMYSDEEGTTGMNFSPDKAETVLGIKNIDYQTVPMDTTNDFHIYRLVRPAHSMYSYLYVDNNPVPAIVDQHADASMGLSATPADAYLEFGYALTPGGLGHVLIDYIRWAPTAYAPPAPGQNATPLPSALPLLKTCPSVQVPTVSGTPGIIASQSSVPSGCPVTISWDGGSSAYACYVFLTDATRNGYSVWSGVSTSGRVDSLTSGTTFTLRCLDTSGAYVSGTPVSVGVEVIH